MANIMKNIKKNDAPERFELSPSDRLLLQKTCQSLDEIRLQRMNEKNTLNEIKDLIKNHDAIEELKNIILKSPAYKAVPHSASSDISENYNEASTQNLYETLSNDNSILEIKAMLASDAAVTEDIKRLLENDTSAIELKAMLTSDAEAIDEIKSLLENDNTIEEIKNLLESTGATTNAEEIQSFVDSLKLLLDDNKKDISELKDMLHSLDLKLDELKSASLYPDGMPQIPSYDEYKENFFQNAPYEDNVSENTPYENNISENIMYPDGIDNISFQNNLENIPFQENNPDSISFQNNNPENINFQDNISDSISFQNNSPENMNFQDNIPAPMPYEAYNVPYNASNTDIIVEELAEIKALINSDNNISEIISLIEKSDNSDELKHLIVKGNDDILNAIEALNLKLNNNAVNASNAADNAKPADKPSNSKTSNYEPYISDLAGFDLDTPKIHTNVTAPEANKREAAYKQVSNEVSKAGSDANNVSLEEIKELLVNNKQLEEVLKLLKTRHVSDNLPISSASSIDADFAASMDAKYNELAYMIKHLSETEQMGGSSSKIISNITLEIKEAKDAINNKMSNIIIFLALILFSSFSTLVMFILSIFKVI